MTEQESTSGVQELIDRLSQEGVADGLRQAEEMLTDARRKGDEIVHTARREAEGIVNDARLEAEQFQAAGEDALRLASRDAVRDLASKVHDGFRNRLRELVKHTLEDEEVLKALVVTIAGKAAPEDRSEALEISLPENVIGDEEVQQQIRSGEEDALTRFVRGITGDALREAVTFEPLAVTGLRIRVVDRDVEIDFTDEAITELLASHLLPRFRGIMRSA